MVRFSFKYFQINATPKFCISEKDGDYFRVLLDRLKQASGLPAREFREVFQRPWRNHAIAFGSEKVSEPGFTCLPIGLREQVEGAAFQFSLTSNEHGRVHGFFIEQVFYVVWCDPGHELYHGEA